MKDNQEVTVDINMDKFGNMCKNTVYNYLKEVGYTYKKNFFYQERDEAKR